MRMLLALFGFVQIAIAGALGFYAEDIARAMLRGDRPVVEVVHGVVGPSEVIESPAGDPFVYGEVTVFGAPDPDRGLRAIVDRQYLGTPQVTVLTTGDRVTLQLPPDLSGWQDVPYDRVIRGEQRLEVRAIRPFDRIWAELDAEGEVKTLWFGGATIGVQTKPPTPENPVGPWRMFVFLAVLLTAASGVFTLGWSAVRL